LPLVFASFSFKPSEVETTIKKSASENEDSILKDQVVVYSATPVNQSHFLE